MAPATFLRKLEQLLSQNRIYIKWEKGGTAFTIKDEPGFIENVLRRYFKHKQMSSFIRQLNNYGFKKVHISNNSDHISYEHPSLRENNYQVVKAIKSKFSVKNKIINKVVRHKTSDALDELVRQENKLLTEKLVSQRKMGRTPRFLTNLRLMLLNNQKYIRWV